MTAHDIILGRNGRPAWRQGNMYEGSFENSLSALNSAGRNYLTVPCDLEAILPDGTRIAVPDKALIRGRTRDDPERRYITTVSPSYAPVQHFQMAEALMNVPNDWPLVMIGSTGRYDTRVFWGFDAGEHKVGGLESELMKKYIYIDSSNDGRTGLHFMSTTVRMQCLNQEATARREASFNIRLRHGAQALVDAQQWVKYFHRAEHALQIDLESFDRMTTLNITTAQCRDALDKIYKAVMPKLVEEFGETSRPGLPDSVIRAQETYATTLQRMQKYRIAAFEEYEKMCDENPRIAGTAWAAYNGVTYIENWRQGRGDDGALESILFGERRKTIEKAYETILAVV